MGERSLWRLLAVERRLIRLSLCKRSLAVYAVVFASATGPANAQDLSPFTSDGCSSFPDGTFAQEQLWLECCEAHDLAYWQGGTYQQRLNADRALEACVAKVGEPEVALLMLAGVRVGGSPLFMTDYRWGYGWPYPRWYGELTDAEQRQVKRLMPAASSTVATEP